MGIPGLCAELGPGRREALSELAVNSLRYQGRPLRLAIDASIWQYQVRSGKGGKNAHLRTLYYRLVKLLSLSIHPLFVFDGVDRPAFKRGKATTHKAQVNDDAKALLNCFGFPYHDAPAEAEAECAMLQRQNVVDAVLSEDVDSFMFGARCIYRNWSSLTHDHKAPSHVDVYDAKDGLFSGIDRDGMVLIALMHAGDYGPGLGKCGIKVACEAARAGFGTGLVRQNGFERQLWRQALEAELHHNANGLFKSRHPTLHIPEDFPQESLLRLYARPLVSDVSAVPKYKQRAVDTDRLMKFCELQFAWSADQTCEKLKHQLAPAVLIHRLVSAGLEFRQCDDVERILGKRTSPDTGQTELRILFRSSEILTFKNPKSQSSCETTSSESKWIPESLVKLGVPEMVELWEDSQQQSPGGQTRLTLQNGPGPKCLKASKERRHQKQASIDLLAETLCSTLQLNSKDQGKQYTVCGRDTLEIHNLQFTPETEGEYCSKIPTGAIVVDLTCM